MNKQQGLSLVLKYVVLGLLTVMFLFPFAWMLATSLKTNSEALTNPTALLPAVPQWGNYPAVIIALNFWRETLNSLVMALGVTLGQILLSALAGYAFARLPFFGRDVLFLLILATLIIPFEILFVPLYLMLAGWGGVAEHVRCTHCSQPGESVRHLCVPPVLHHDTQGAG